MNDGNKSYKEKVEILVQPNIDATTGSTPEYSDYRTELLETNKKFLSFFCEAPLLDDG
jgi:hypothetical protein